MKIAVPKEIKNNENRVGLVPSGARQLVQDGHEVFVQHNAGMGIGITDEEYIKAGAKIVATLEDGVNMSGIDLMRSLINQITTGDVKLNSNHVAINKCKGKL